MYRKYTPQQQVHSPRPVVSFYLAAVSSAMHRRCIAPPNPSPPPLPSGGRVQRKRSMLMPLINLRNRFISLRRGGAGRAAAKIHQEMDPHVRRSFVTWTPEKSDGGQQGFVSLTSNNLRLCGIEFTSYPTAFRPPIFTFILRQSTRRNVAN